MQQNLKQLILDSTQGGLDVLLSLYPQARDCVDNKNKKFKIRQEEKTPSTIINQKDGVWYVNDFGDTGHPMNCFDAYMRECSINSFSECLYRIADEFNIDYRLKPEINKPKNIEFRDAGENDTAGEFRYEKKESPSKADLDCFGPFVKDKTLEKYHYYSLNWYEQVFVNKKTNRLTIKRVTSSDDYPIFYHDCGEFGKIYCPMAYNKEDRFRHSGIKPKDYIYGYKEAYSAYEKLIQENNDDDFDTDEKASKKQKIVKLDAIYICSGERDAMNVAGLGYYPIWLNSETAGLTEQTMIKLRTIATCIYNIPDIDDTGVKAGNKMALEHMDIYTIELPQWLLTFKDKRGRPRKDLRDFLELRPFNSEFTKLKKTAKQAKFWNIKDSGKEQKKEITSVNLLHYLKLNGFYKLKNPITNELELVHITGYQIEPVNSKNIRDFIRTDLKKRQVENAAYEAYINSKKTTQSIYDDLETLELNFTVSEPKTRTLFFNNCCVKIPMGTKDNLEITGERDIKAYSWKDKIIPHNFKPLPAEFFVDENGILNFEKPRSNCFKYLINASRIYWREEFEERKSDNDEENSKYREEFKFDIYGSRLTNDEKIEHMKHLMSKLWAIGFLLHHYKFDSRALCLWIMENKLTAEDESSGGSGKSFFMRMFHYLKLANIVTLDGRDKDLTNNNHFLDRVSTATDILFVDDAAKSFDFNSFYGKITGVLTINPKGTQSFEIDYRDSPYVAISSNFPPPSDERSTLRRLLPLVYSDYYHEQGDDNKYLETRKIADDFGHDLFDYQYTEDDYLNDYNFMIDCIQFYLNNQDKIFRPPMERIIQRIQLKEMGDTFKDWAEQYYSTENDNLDKLIYRDEIYKDYLNFAGTGKYVKNPINFKRSLEAFAKFMGYTFNPPEAKGYNEKGKRITINTVINMVRKSYEYFYMQTPGKEINNRLATDIFG